MQPGIFRTQSRIVSFARGAVVPTWIAAAFAGCSLLGIHAENKSPTALAAAADASDKRPPEPPATTESGDYARPPAPPPPPPVGEHALAPLDPGKPIQPLTVEGFRDAVVSIPNGATSPRPVVVALHGNYDRPEWQCETLRAVTKAYPFVVCPRGKPRTDVPATEDRWTYGKAADVRHEIDAALAALGVRFGDYVANGPMLFAGFSLGAILGVTVVSDDPDRFRRAILIEGGHTNWSEARAKEFASSGGKRILFACGQRTCKADAKTASKLLARAGVDAKALYDGEVGHIYDGKVADQIAAALPWLVGDDPRWETAGVADTQ